MRRQVLPEGHPGIATPLHNLTRLLVASGRATQAVPLAREALALRSNHQDAWHPLRLRTGLLLAEAQAAAGDPAGARSTLEPLAALQRQHHPEQPALQLQLQLTLAAIAAAEGQAVERAAALAAAVEALSRSIAPAHPRAAALRLRLAQARLAAGDPDSARREFAAIAPILRAALLPHAPALTDLAALENAL
jgi:hypothetical protein